MNKLCLAILLALSFNIYSWDDKSPSGLISGNYVDMFFDDAGEYGWAVGSGGKVIKLLMVEITGYRLKQGLSVTLKVYFL